MTREPDRPWQKGPAQIIPFPVPPVRCWWIRRLPCGGWRGEVLGPDVDGSRFTGIGEYALVFKAVVRDYNRRGLPIIIAQVGGNLQPPVAGCAA